MAYRHIVIGGSSFTGSTLFGLVLGALDGFENVGESNWLTPRFGEANDDPSLWNDYSEQPQCRLCGQSCELWTKEFRQELQRDPSNWYPRLAERLGGHTLVSSEKTPANIKSLDASLNNTTLVLFKTPFQHWASVAKRPWKTQSLAAAMTTWSKIYDAFLDDAAYNPQGGKVFLNIEHFLETPESGLRTLCAALDVPFDPAALRYWESKQHYIGGNFSSYERVKTAPHKLEVRSFIEPVKAADRQAIREHHAFDVYTRLMERAIM